MEAVESGRSGMVVSEYCFDPMIVNDIKMPHAPFDIELDLTSRVGSEIYLIAEG